MYYFLFFAAKIDTQLRNKICFLLTLHPLRICIVRDMLCNRPRFIFPQTDSNEYRDSVDRVEVIKLPAHSTNGSVLSAPPTYTSSSSSGSSNANNNINDSDAPLNLSLKPATTSSSSPISGSQPLSQLSNLSQSLLASDRTCKYSNCARRYYSSYYRFKAIVVYKVVAYFYSMEKLFVE